MPKPIGHTRIQSQLRESNPSFVLTKDVLSPRLLSWHVNFLMSKFGLGVLVKLKDPIRDNFPPEDPSVPIVGVVRWVHGESCFVNFPRTEGGFVDKDQLEILSEREIKEFLVRRIMKSQWSLQESNLPPLVCQTSALPDELRPRKFGGAAGDRTRASSLQGSNLVLQTTPQWRQRELNPRRTAANGSPKPVSIPVGLADPAGIEPTSQDLESCSPPWHGPISLSSFHQSSITCNLDRLAHVDD